MEEYVLLCEDSLDGILSGIYEAYIWKKEKRIQTHDRIHLAVKEPETQRLFTQYVRMAASCEKADKVSETLKRELGEEAYHYLCLIMVSYEEDKADAAYHTVVAGLENHDKDVFMRLSNDYVNRAFIIGRNVNNEVLHLKQFLRFQELDSGMLYAKIGPKNNIITYLARHFSDRLPSDNFVIYDDTRGLFALHPKQKPWYLVSGQEFDEEKLVFTEKEEEYRRLFTYFCKKIAIESRINPKQQMNMLPLRFRPYMTEFQENNGK